MTVTEREKTWVMVEVTERDIALGRRASALWCPVALATKRALQRAHVEVSRKRIVIPPEWDDDGDELTWETPAVVERWVRRFDEGERVKPFGFRMEIDW